MKTLITLLIITCALCVSAGQYMLTNITEMDGDTIRANVHLGFGIMLQNTSVRLGGIDTPEIHTKNLLEKEAGKLVTALLMEKIKNATELILITNDKKECGKFGRPMGIILLDGRDVNKVLVSMKCAKDYHGERKKKWTDKELNYIIELLVKYKINKCRKSI